MKLFALRLPGGDSADFWLDKQAENWYDTYAFVTLDNTF
jgi:hypothetical protein